MSSPFRWDCLVLVNLSLSYTLVSGDISLGFIWKLFIRQLTANVTLSLPAIFKHNARTAALSVAWLAPCALVGKCATDQVLLAIGFR